MSGNPVRRLGATIDPVRPDLAASRRDRRPASPATRRMSPAVLCVALAALVASLSLSPATVRTPADAATPPGLEARAEAISATISADDAELSAVGLQYVREAETLTQARAAERRAHALLAQLHREVAFERAILLGAAIDAYVGSGSQTAAALYLTDAPDQALSGSIYLNAATDVLDAAIVAYGERERSVITTAAAAAADAASARQALARSTAARDVVLAEVAHEQALLSSVNGQLAALVAAEAAARERAAEEREAARAAAEAAAQAAAQQATQSTDDASGATSAGPPPPSAVASIDLNAGVPASLSADFAAIRNCESGNDYSLSTGNGYYGAYQFSESTWIGLGESGYPNQASAATQDAAAYTLYQSSGWSSWPECAAIAGLQ